MEHLTFDLSFFKELFLFWYVVGCNMNYAVLPSSLLKQTTSNFILANLCSVTRTMSRLFRRNWLNDGSGCPDHITNWRISVVSFYFKFFVTLVNNRENTNTGNTGKTGTPLEKKPSVCLFLRWQGEGVNYIEHSACFAVYPAYLLWKAVSCTLHNNI